MLPDPLSTVIVYLRRRRRRHVHAVDLFAHAQSFPECIVSGVIEDRPDKREHLMRGRTVRCAQWKVVDEVRKFSLGSLGDQVERRAKVGDVPTWLRRRWNKAVEIIVVTGDDREALLSDADCSTATRHCGDTHIDPPIMPTLPSDHAWVHQFECIVASGPS